MTLTFLERLRPRRDGPAMPVFDGLAQVRAYWEALRDRASLPARAALDPRGLSGVLDRVFLAERIGRGLAQVRIAGSGLSDLAGVDLKGLPLSCLFASEARPLLAQVLEQAFTEPAVAEIDLGSDRGQTGIAIARLLLLPLADEAGGKVLLGALSFANGEAPRCKFEVLARREERVLLQPSPVPQKVAAEPIRRFGHLALVHTNA
ncbi:PAS domain-containing protein [Tabrizicola sp.]|uniref:PAS domain-containing protein n=1 Tax=Tabrizicola sp. TaxID=2005166 RepID=UPI003F2F36FF